MTARVIPINRRSRDWRAARVDKSWDDCLCARLRLPTVTAWLVVIAIAGLVAIPFAVVVGIIVGLTA